LKNIIYTIAVMLVVSAALAVLNGFNRGNQPPPVVTVEVSCQQDAKTMMIFAEQRDKGVSQAVIHSRIDNMQLGAVKAKNYHSAVPTVYKHTELTPTQVSARTYSACMAADGG